MRVNPIHAFSPSDAVPMPTTRKNQIQTLSMQHRRQILQDRTAQVQKLLFQQRLLTNSSATAFFLLYLFHRELIRRLRLSFFEC